MGFCSPFTTYSSSTTFYVISISLYCTPLDITHRHSATTDKYYTAELSFFRIYFTDLFQHKLLLFWYVWVSWCCFKYFSCLSLKEIRWFFISVHWRWLIIWFSLIVVCDGTVFLSNYCEKKKKIETNVASWSSYRLNENLLGWFRAVRRTPWILSYIPFFELGLFSSSIFSESCISSRHGPPSCTPPCSVQAAFVSTRIGDSWYLLL